MTRLSLRVTTLFRSLLCCNTFVSNRKREGNFGVSHFYRQQLLKKVFVDTVNDELKREAKVKTLLFVPAIQGHNPGILWRLTENKKFLPFHWMRKTEEIDRMRKHQCVKKKNRDALAVVALLSQSRFFKRSLYTQR